jgi:hypothetical protein
MTRPLEKRNVILSKALIRAADRLGLFERQPASPAAEAFAKAQREIETALARLTEHDFSVDPENINWGHVGTMNAFAAKLREVTDAVFKEGDHAE